MLLKPDFNKDTGKKVNQKIQNNKLTQNETEHFYPFQRSESGIFFYKGIGDFVSAYCNVFVTQSCTTFGDFFSRRTTLQKEGNEKKTNKKTRK